MVQAWSRQLGRKAGDARRYGCGVPTRCLSASGGTSQRRLMVKVATEVFQHFKQIDSKHQDTSPSTTPPFYPSSSQPIKTRDPWYSTRPSLASSLGCAPAEDCYLSVTRRSESFIIVAMFERARAATSEPSLAPKLSKQPQQTERTW